MRGMTPSSPVCAERLIFWRRQLHRHAESGLSEFWTTAFLASQLAAAGLDVQVGERVMDRAALMGQPDAATQAARLEQARSWGADPAWLERMHGLTGLVVDLRPDLPPHTAIRFDIDAVDVRESGDSGHFPAAQGFASLTADCAHACGHDGHAAIGLGVALELAARRDRLRRNVRLIFQPGEEGCRGARPMLAAGVARGVRHFLAVHIGAGATTPHSLVCGTRGFLATSKFDVEFFGRAAHSGASPHLGRNSLLAAACATLNLHALPRHGEGDTRVSVGRLESGSGRNIIPDHARMLCETRAVSTELNEHVFAAARRVIEHAAAMYEQEFSVTLTGSTGCAASDPAMAAIVRQAGEEIPWFRKDAIADSGAAFGSDDACAFLEEVQRNGGMGSYLLIGSALAAGHHNERFDFQEEVLAPAVELLCRCALKLDAIV